MAFGKNTLVEGGGLPFADGGRGRILYARWVADVPDGYTSEDDPLFFKLAIQPLGKKDKPEGDVVVEHYRAGSSDDYIPINSKGKEVGYGTDLEAVGGKDGLNDSTKFAILLDHFIDAGLPEDHAGINEDTSELDGFVFAWHRIDEPEEWAEFRKGRQHPARRNRRGQEPETTTERRRTILVPKEWDEDASDASEGGNPEDVDAEAGEQREKRETDKEEGSRRGKSASDRAKGGSDKGDKSGSRRSKSGDGESSDADKPKRGRRSTKDKDADEPKSRRRRSAEPDQEPSSDFDADATAVEVLLEVCNAKGEIEKKGIRRAVFAALKSRDLDSADAKAVTDLATSEKFLKSLDEDSGLDWDGKSIAALE